MGVTASILIECLLLISVKSFFECGAARSAGGHPAVALEGLVGQTQAEIKSAAGAEKNAMIPNLPRAEAPFWVEVDVS